MGIQGSGKSTMAHQLQKDFGYIHVCTGDLLRKHIAEGTEFGKSYQAAYNRGEMAPSEVTCGIIGDAFYGYTDEHIILDGFPRNDEQLKWLDDRYRVVKCILLVLPVDVAMERLFTRKRTDDTEASITKRFELYREHTEPIIAHYSKIDKLIMLDGNHSIDEVFNNVADALSAL